MTTLSMVRIPHLNLVSAICTYYIKISNNLSNARKFRKTVIELNKLSPRILEDIGLSKSNINSVAHHHVYGKQKK